MFYETLKIFTDFSQENTMAMVTMNMVSTGRFSGVSFHLRRCPQGVASVLCKKTPIFGSQRSKLDHLTVPDVAGWSRILERHMTIFRLVISNRVHETLSTMFYKKLASCSRSFFFLLFGLTDNSSAYWVHSTDFCCRLASVTWYAKLIYFPQDQ